MSGGIIGSSFYIKSRSTSTTKLTPVLVSSKDQLNTKRDTQASDSSVIKLNANQENQANELLPCSNGLDNIKCSEGYTCYHSVPGGPAPLGTPPEPTSGDKKCHKNCIFDKDCPSNTPICVKKTIQIGDVSGPNKNICFSKDDGLKDREEQYHDCLSSKEAGYDQAVANGKNSDQEIIVSLPAKYHSELLTKEFGLNILGETKDIYGSILYSVIPLDKSKENFLKVACQLDLDTRINNVTAVYKGEPF